MLPLPHVEFHFDFGSPNCYLARTVLEGIEQRTSAQVAYVPVLLGGIFKLTNNQSPATAFAAVPSKMAYNRLETSRFIRRHGLERFRPNPHFPVNTVLIMRVAVAAELDGQLHPVMDAMFRAMWEDGFKMDHPAVVRTALDAAGLDGARLLACTQDPTIKDRLIQNTQRSVDRGVFGAPTFFLGEDMFFGKDRLHDVEDAIMKRQTA